MDNFDNFMAELNNVSWDDVDDMDYIEDYRPRRRRRHDDDNDNNNDGDR